MRFRRTAILLILITTLAFLLRVYGINYYSYGDEAYHVYNSIGLGSGQLPNNFHRIALFVFYSLLYVLGWIGGIFTAPGDFIGTYFSQQHVFYYTGRLFEALVGTAAVPLLYLLGRRTFSDKPAVVAALFLAVSPAAVEISQIARGQALALALVIGAMYSLHRAGEEDRTSLYILAGLGLGAAISIRIFCVIIIIPMAGYFWFGNDDPTSPARPGRRGERSGRLLRRRGIWLVLASAVAIFILSNPGIVLRFRTYMVGNLGNITGGFEAIYPGCEHENSWKYYLTAGFPTALSWPLYLLFLAGAVRAVIKKDRTGVVLALTCVIFFLVMGKGMIAAPRYLFPIVPACLLLGADFICRLAGGDGPRGRPRRWLLPLAALLLAAPAGRTVIEANRRSRLKTTKNLAEEWIFGNIPYGSRIAVERMGYSGPDLKLTPVLDYWIYNLSEPELKELLLERTEQGQASFALRYFIDHPPERKYHTDTISVREVVDPRALEREGYEYVVTIPAVGEIFKERLVREKYPELCAGREEFSRWIARKGVLLKLFLPDEDTPGDEIRVYRISEKQHIR